MKTKSAITDFYYKTLYPDLKDLEDKRQQLKQKVLSIGAFIVLIASLVAFYIISHNLPIDFLIFDTFATVVVLSILYKKMTKNYAREFKELIIAPLIKEIESSFNYQPYKYISPAYFNRAKFFTSNPDRTSGNDYVTGKIDGIEVTFCDFHAEKKHKDSKGRTSWSTMFQGLFVVTEFPKKFHSSTIVLPDFAQNIFGDFIGSLLQANNFSRKQLVKMDSPEFEKNFVVYGDDQVEARYILTPAFMQRILNFKKRSQAPLYLSFRGNIMYMGISYNKDMFEPSVFRSLLEYKIAMEYVDTLHLVMGLVDDLKLNQKLWSKL